MSKDYKKEIDREIKQYIEDFPYKNRKEVIISISRWMKILQFTGILITPRVYESYLNKIDFYVEYVLSIDRHQYSYKYSVQSNLDIAYDRAMQGL